MGEVMIGSIIVNNKSIKKIEQQTGLYPNRSPTYNEVTLKIPPPPCISP